jgi:hypothetical protein
MWFHFGSSQLRKDTRDPVVLTKAVLQAARKGDRRKLEALMCSPKDFGKFVRPRFSIRSRSAIGPDYAACKMASDEALDGLIRQLNGKQLTIRRIAILTIQVGKPRRWWFKRSHFPREFFGSGPNVTLADADGSQMTFSPIGAILGHRGIYRVVTYSADPLLFVQRKGYR